MHKDRARTLLLRAMIGFFAVGGLLAALFFLIRSFGDLEARTLGTVFSLGFFGLFGLVCARELDTPSLRVIAKGGIVSSVLATVLSQILILGHVDWDDGFATLLLILTVLSSAAAHVCLIWNERVSKLVQRVTWATMFCIAVVSPVLIHLVVIDFDIPDGYWRLLGFFGVLDVAGS